MLKHLAISLLCTCLSATALAVEEPPADRSEPIYLIGQLKLDGSNMSYSIFLHEDAVTSLDQCNAAWQSGQQGDWPHYFHVFRRDLIQGFSAHIQYRCATSTQSISSWEELRDYRKSYLVHIDRQRLTLKPYNSFAACSRDFGYLSSADQANRFCTKSSQELR